MAAADISLQPRPYPQDISAPEPPLSLHGPLADAPHDDLDDLFNYDEDAEMVNANRGPNYGNEESTKQRDEDSGIGIDEEVKVRKKRAPLAKLDEEKLLSQNGIPKLRKITKERLRFRGKGHEFTDVARLLSMYQLWLDDLFPKAKFDDGLSLIEKLGHKKRLKVMRQAWIDEEKPKLGDADDEQDGGGSVNAHAEPEDNGGSLFLPDHERQADEHEGRSASDADLYKEPTPRPTHPDGGNNDAASDSPELDELDALLAENDNAQLVSGALDGQVWRQPEKDFADDEEAMAGIW